MGTPLSLFTGAWFTLFGGAVIWWCAVEVRLRRTLRRVGVNGMARVVPASALERVAEPVGVATAGPAPSAAVDRAAGHDHVAVDRAADDQATDVDQTADVDHADNAPLLSFEVEGHGEVVTRPRGWTSIRRSAALPVDALVPVRYDPQEPTRVALEGVPQSRSDLFWLLLGLLFAVCGVTLLATAF
ncbi:hypothetical protein DN069_31845 [Streptacidiphilus pinicola]|uniref:DUF3592 domain-containing protein n=1 Tax=Streptacidiphilus pinicola TaxID=2219663 RepID=A0A2X0K2V7_9ACTN|nr:DUF3592 domain-containing protein [Streptacidiphilus pinicola]RAG81640.1 hypothetical protein DN069_31845 [Streptacidiphilus pinicola]